MIKKYIAVISIIFFSILIFPSPLYAYSGLNGKILLQVESKGEAWYVYPKTGNRYYLGRPDDAFSIMRKLGLGAKHEYIMRTEIFPENLLGMILLDVEQNGEAYYIHPNDSRKYYLGRPNDAFEIMRSKSLGISDSDLDKIVIAENSVNPDDILNWYAIKMIDDSVYYGTCNDTESNPFILENAYFNHNSPYQEAGFPEHPLSLSKIGTTNISQEKIKLIEKLSNTSKTVITLVEAKNLK